MSKPQTPDDPAVMNTESYLLRIEDDFNKEGDSCSDTFGDNCNQLACQPTLPPTSIGTLPIWTIHPLTLWTSVSQGATTSNWPLKSKKHNESRCSEQSMPRVPAMYAEVVATTTALAGRDSRVQIATGIHYFCHQWVLMLMLSVAGAQVARSQAFAASTTETVSLLLTGGFDHLSLLSFALLPHLSCTCGFGQSHPTPHLDRFKTIATFTLWTKVDCHLNCQSWWQ